MEVFGWSDGVPEALYPYHLLPERGFCSKTVLLVFSALRKIALSTLGRCKEDLSVVNK
jgi:hypothetical protein